MKLPRYPTQADWEEIVAFGPGSRMFRGKMTLFYNGEILYDNEFEKLFIYDLKERRSWQVIIVLPGVEVIPWDNFSLCFNVKMIIMADTVKRVEEHAFNRCTSLVYVRFSRNLEYIGRNAFRHCSSICEIFIPPSCREIEIAAFDGCKKLIIFNVSPTTDLSGNVIAKTALFEVSPFETRHYRHEEVNTWIKSINNSEGLTLHRICSSGTPNTEQIYRYVKDHGLRAMKFPNSIGITPSQYLAANPYFEFEEGKLVKRYILEMMGEVVQEQA